MFFLSKELLFKTPDLYKYIQKSNITLVLWLEASFLGAWGSPSGVPTEEWSSWKNAALTHLKSRGLEKNIKFTSQLGGTVCNLLGHRTAGFSWFRAHFHRPSGEIPQSGEKSVAVLRFYSPESCDFYPSPAFSTRLLSWVLRSLDAKQMENFKLETDGSYFKEKKNTKKFIMNSISAIDNQLVVVQAGRFAASEVFKALLSLMR